MQFFYLKITVIGNALNTNIHDNRKDYNFEVTKISHQNFNLNISKLIDRNNVLSTGNFDKTENVKSFLMIV